MMIKMDDQAGERVVPLRHWILLIQGSIHSGGSLASMAFTRTELEDQMERIKVARKGYQHYPREWIIVAIPLLGRTVFLVMANFRHLAKTKKLERPIILFENNQKKRTVVMTFPDVRDQEMMRMIPRSPGTLRIPKKPACPFLNNVFWILILISIFIWSSFCLNVPEDFSASSIYSSIPSFTHSYIYSLIHLFLAKFPICIKRDYLLLLFKFIVN